MTILRLRRLAAATSIAVLVGACGSVAPTPSASGSADAPGPTSAARIGSPAPGALGDDDVRGDVGSPAPAASGTPTAPPATPRPTTPAPPAATPPPPTPSLPPTTPFAVNLYRQGDYVRQYTFEWCVGASIQMTLAMTDASHDMSRERQQEIWEMARDTSFSPFGGANPNGWVATLNDLGVGPYEMVSEPTLEAALRRAASAIVETDRPVGLVMWRGRHAWVMSGFESLGDPRTRPDFQVTGVNVLDPLHPHGSRQWGPSPAPNELVTPEVLGAQFIARTGGRVQLPVPPGYILILPTTA